MLVLNPKKGKEWSTITTYASLVHFIFIIIFIIIFFFSDKPHNIIYFIPFYFLILLFTSYHLLHKKKMTVDKEFITFEEFIFTHRFRGKRGRTEDVKLWYIKDMNQSNSDGMEIHIVFESGKKIIVKESQFDFDDFFELRKLLNFDALYKDKKSTWRR